MSIDFKKLNEAVKSAKEEKEKKEVLLKEAKELGIDTSKFEIKEEKKSVDSTSEEKKGSEEKNGINSITKEELELMIEKGLSKTTQDLNNSKLEDDEIVPIYG